MKVDTDVAQKGKKNPTIGYTGEEEDEVLGKKNLVFNFKTKK